MAAAQEGPESLRERTRRALLDNPDPVVPAMAHQTAAQPQLADSASATDHIQQRLHAIQQVRELEPRRACYAEQVRDLSQSLSGMSEHSVHFRTMLDRLREAHAEWQALEERLQAAQYIIRSTQWLVDMLADPLLPEREVATGEKQ